MSAGPLARAPGSEKLSLHARRNGAQVASQEKARGKGRSGGPFSFIAPYWRLRPVNHLHEREIFSRCLELLSCYGDALTCGLRWLRDIAPRRQDHDEHNHRDRERDVPVQDVLQNCFEMKSRTLVASAPWRIIIPMVSTVKMCLMPAATI